MTGLLRRYLDSRRALIERALRGLAASFSPRFGANALLGRSMRHSLFPGGKRLRPLLVLAAAEACGRAPESVLPAACAVELIHTYSLIHDDLPAMDDDDLRRGRPANHKLFGEGLAILAGDALLTLAFELLADNARGPAARAADALEAVRVLSAAAGPRGMVAGQAADLLEEASDSARPGPALRRLRFIHRNKTAALFAACLETGAVLARAPAWKRSALRAYGENLGLAFQITDDILDRAGDKKPTLPRAAGLEAARRSARRYSARARRALSPLGERAWMLRELLGEIETRDR